MNYLIPAWEIIAFITFAALAVMPLLKLNIRIAPFVGLIDWPKARGMSQDQVPIIGPAIGVFFVLVASVVALFYGEISSWFIVTCAIITVMGYFDDRNPLSAIEKMFWQIVCVSTLLFFDPRISSQIVETHGVLGVVLGGLFILGAMNAFNFIDGIDGLAGTISIIAALGAISFMVGQFEYYPYVILISTLIGSLISFLVLNLGRKGFLGNTGSYLLGYAIAYFHLAAPVHADSILSRLSLNGLCFVIPIADGIVVVMSRLLTVRSPFMADKGHLHHRMVQTSVRLREVLGSFGTVSLLGMAVAVALNYTPGVSFGLTPFVVCVSVVGITGLLIVLLEKASKKRVQSYMDRIHQSAPLYYYSYNLVSDDVKKPLSPARMRRLEAKISAEIRVTDVCFTKDPDQLFVIVTSDDNPSKWVLARFEAVFLKEKLTKSVLSETGILTKSPSQGNKPATSADNVIRLRQA